MSRTLRYIPHGGALVEVTLRTFQGRFFLRPSQYVNDIVIGVFAQAQQRYGVEVCALVVLTNHYHALLSVDSAQQLSRFMNFVNGNLARKVGRVIRWGEKFWAKRYTSVVVSEEEAAQVARLRYLLSQGVKEDLVESPAHWPGVHCADALVRGEPLRGFWFDQSRRSAGLRRGKSSDPYEYASPQTLCLSALPCWRSLPPPEVRRRVGELVTEIVAEHRLRRSQRGRRVLGRRRVLRRNPHSRARPVERRPVPLFHAFRREVRRRFRVAYGIWLAAYREAAERLKAGDREAEFPPGSFPPPLPFVP